MIHNKKYIDNQCKQISELFITYLKAFAIDKDVAPQLSVGLKNTFEKRMNYIINNQNIETSLLLKIFENQFYFLFYNTDFKSLNLYFDYAFCSDSRINTPMDKQLGHINIDWYYKIKDVKDLTSFIRFELRKTTIPVMELI